MDIDVIQFCLWGENFDFLVIKLCNLMDSDFINNTFEKSHIRSQNSKFMDLIICITHFCVQWHIGGNQVNYLI